MGWVVNENAGVRACMHVWSVVVWHGGAVWCGGAVVPACCGVVLLAWVGLGTRVHVFFRTTVFVPTVLCAAKFGASPMHEVLQPVHHSCLCRAHR